MKMVIRADAGPTVGAGHVMRCRAVAEATKAHGWDACFAAQLNCVVDVARFAGNTPVLPLGGDFEDEAALLATLVPGDVRSCWWTAMIGR